MIFANHPFSFREQCPAQATARRTDGVASDGRPGLRLLGQEHPCFQVLENTGKYRNTAVFRFQKTLTVIQVLIFSFPGTMSASSSASREKLPILSEHSGNPYVDFRVDQ